ncbi:hypothetical protein MUN84_17570 [Hymenobacter sp. 5516J-16]|uniref:hypothetical protein n=1 Tax=Hymenobacter sp. 5516J-16 TaxID=2932253 RepID=UPI001FD3FB74|nr:hypothetical protein [Hymenobacter sp. 5516J-16]UOQ76358.1 hypothetical protein MUN84_17570 [Hymenobacter sp. 5516J-16]
MKWLPSFVKLFLLFILGFALQIVSTFGMMQGPSGSSSYDILRLLGLLLMVVAFVLIGLKFFSRLDQKP